MSQKLALCISLAMGLNTAFTGIHAEEIDQLGEILVEDSFLINPNAATPGNVNQGTANYADGSDFLKQINGVSGGRFGGRGIEPVIRGQSQTQLNVLLDGSVVYSSCPNRMDPPASWAALDTYEKVTVLKGVQSLAYGAGGSGGTVLFERDSRALAEDEGTHGRVGIMGNSNGTHYDAMADVVYGADNYYIRALADQKNNGNYKDGNGREVRSSYQHLQSGLIAGYLPDENSLIEFSYDNTQALDVLYPGTGMDSPEEKGKVYKLRYLDQFENPLAQSLKFEIYQSDLDHRMDNFSLRSYNSANQMQTLTTSLTNGGRLIIHGKINQQEIEYGIDWDNNQRDATMYKIASGSAKSMSIMWPDIRVQKSGFFAQSNKQLGSDKTLKYGLRIDLVNAHFAKADTPSQLMMGHTANQSYNSYYGTQAKDKNETNLAFLLRYQQQLNRQLAFFAGISRTVRTADATERGVNKWTSSSSDRWIGNPDIKAEKHNQIDIGISLQGNDFRSSLSVYFDQVSDYILRDSASGQSGILLADNADIYRNINAQIGGLEIEGSKKLNQHYSIQVNLAYVDKNNTTDNRAIAQTPPTNGKIQLDYQASANWSAGGKIRFALAQNKVDMLSKQEVGQTPAWGVIDLYGHYRFGEMVNLRYGIDNLLNANYAEHISRSNLLDNQATRVNEPGRTIWAKLTTEF